VALRVKDFAAIVTMDAARQQSACRRGAADGRSVGTLQKAERGCYTEISAGSSVVERTLKSCVGGSINRPWPPHFKAFTGGQKSRLRAAGTIREHQIPACPSGPPFGFH